MSALSRICKWGFNCKNSWIELFFFISFKGSWLKFNHITTPGCVNNNSCLGHGRLLEVIEKPWNGEQALAFYQIVNPMAIFVLFGHHFFNKFNSNHRQELLKCMDIGGVAGKKKEDGFIKGSVKMETQGQREDLKCELCILKTCEQVTCGPSPDQSCSSSRVHQIKFRSFPPHPASQCFILLESGNAYWGACTVPFLFTQKISAFS